MRSFVLTVMLEVIRAYEEMTRAQDNLHLATAAAEMAVSRLEEVEAQWSEGLIKSVGSTGCGGATGCRDSESNECEVYGTGRCGHTAQCVGCDVYAWEGGQ